MTKLERLQRKYSEIQTTRAQLEKEISDLKEKHPLLVEKAERIAKTGDVDEYIQAQAEADRTGAELHVKEVLLSESNAPIEKEEALDAWNEYAKKADTNLDKKCAEFRRMRQELFERFLSIKNDIIQSHEVREMLLSYCGVTPWNKLPWDYKNQMRDFAMDELPRDISDSLRLFKDAGMINHQDACDIMFQVNQGAV